MEDVAFKTQLDSIFEAMTEGIVILNRDGELTYLNTRAQKLLGLKANRVSMQVHEASTSSPIESDKNHLLGESRFLKELIKTAKPVYGVEHKIGLPDGHKLTLSFNAAPIHDGSGAPVGVIVSITDLTAYKQIEEALRDSEKRYRTLFESAKKAIELGNALNEINAAINSTLDFNEIMQRVVVEAARATGAETSAIALRADDCWHIKFLHGQMNQLAGAKLNDETAKGMVVAASTGKPVVVNDALSDDRVNPEMMRKLGIRSVMVLPLTIKDEAIGILFFAFHSDKVVFTDAQIDFASKLGASVSLALENARLYQAKRNIADTLQEALLIMPGKLKGVDFACLYRSATESARVGGDFYDLFELDDGRVGIVIGDVSGKGLEAATLTSLVKNTIRIHACDDHSPASIMKKVNDVLQKFCPLNSFVTSFFCILDTRTGRLTYCNAGHPPAFIKKKTSGLHTLATGSPIIGAFTEFDYANGEMILEKGDALILYTDGITEARCSAGFFGDERLIELLNKLTYLEAEDILRAIFDEIIEFTGGLLADDIALLSITLRDD